MENKWKTKKNNTASIIIFILIIFISLFFRIIFEFSDIKFYRWLIGPAVFIVELYTGKIFIFNPSSGYESIDLMFTIDKSCSGSSFLIIILITSSFAILSIKNLKNFYFILNIPVCFILTIAANSVRIILSITLLTVRDSSEVLSGAKTWFHNAVGIFVFLLCILSYYYLIQRGIIWKTKNQS